MFGTDKEELPSNTNNIYDIIKEEGRADVTDLCKRLSLSESTVRRALLALENKRLVRRYHGGAAIVSRNLPELPVYGRMSDYPEEKQRIAKAAAAHVEEDDIVLLTGGTTVAAMCEYLKEIPNLTVITDSLLVINSLLNAPALKLISLGGILNIDEQSFEGIVTASSMKLLRFNKMFLGIKGISADDGYLTDDIRQADFYRLCATRAVQLFILGAHNKFYMEGIMPLFSPGEPFRFITDKKAPRSIVEELEKQGCAVEIV